MRASARTVVDARFRGDHGIGRYATEVLGRIHFERQLKGGDPYGFKDILNRERISLRSTELLYSPSFAAGFTRAQQILTLHDLTHLRIKAGDGRDQLRSAYYDRIVRPAIRRSGLVLTVSETSATDIREWVGGSVQVVNAGNGCSKEFTGTVPAGDRKDFLLYVGNLKGHKNFKLALEVLRIKPEYKLVVVTAAPSQAEGLISASGLNERVEVRGGLSDVQLADLYRTASVLVFPSTWEGFGLPALEAASCGCPVAYLSECRSVAEILNESGYGAEENSPESLAAAIEAARRDGLSTVQVESLRKRYDWETVAQKVHASLTAVGEA